MARLRVLQEHRRKTLLGLNGDPRYYGIPAAPEPGRKKIFILHTNSYSIADPEVGEKILRTKQEYELRPVE